MFIEPGKHLKFVQAPNFLISENNQEVSCHLASQPALNSLFQLVLPHYHFHAIFDFV